MGLVAYWVAGAGATAVCRGRHGTRWGVARTWESARRRRCASAGDGYSRVESAIGIPRIVRPGADGRDAYGVRPEWRASHPAEAPLRKGVHGLSWRRNSELLSHVPGHGDARSGTRGLLACLPGGAGVVPEGGDARALARRVSPWPGRHWAQKRRVPMLSHFQPPTGGLLADKPDVDALRGPGRPMFRCLFPFVPGDIGHRNTGTAGDLDHLETSTTRASGAKPRGWVDRAGGQPRSAH